jgi:hypothetical protein
VVRELGWFEAGDEKVLGMMSFDRSDEDYAWYVLGRDVKGLGYIDPWQQDIPDEFKMAAWYEQKDSRE